MNNSIKKHTTQSGFTIINNSIFMDKNLSLKAKGLLCQLLSLPDNWSFSEMGLTKIVNDGRASIRSAIKELEDNKYLHRERTREGGKLKGTIYHIYETPFEPKEKEDKSGINYEPQNIPPSYYYDWMKELD